MKSVKPQTVLGYYVADTEVPVIATVERGCPFHWEVRVGTHVSFSGRAVERAGAVAFAARRLGFLYDLHRKCFPVSPLLWTEDVAAEVA